MYTQPAASKKLRQQYNITELYILLNFRAKHWIKFGDFYTYAQFGSCFLYKDKEIIVLIHIFTKKTPNEKLCTQPNRLFDTYVIITGGGGGGGREEINLVPRSADRNPGNEVEKRFVT